jgi:hypothetical protein
LNNWEKLCKQINPLISKGVDEDILHSQFEMYLQTIFNWDDANIKHKPPVQIGREKKQADIVLTSNDFGIVIEMKHPGIELDDEARSQLFGYMRILNYKYGFLIGNEMIIFYDDDTIGEQPLEVVRFNFDAKNVDGISLCDILDKKNCSNEKLKEFMLMMIKNRQEKEKNERLKFELLNNNGARIKEILKEKLLFDGYKEEVIINIISDIAIYPKNHIDGSGGGPVPLPSKPQDNTPRDNTIEQFSDKCILIKIKQESIYKNNGDIYKTVRRCWHNKISYVQQADYVLAVVDSIVREVYKPTDWYKPKLEECNKNCPTNDVSRPCGRIAFNGELANDEARNRYKDKWIPSEYRKQGMANPVLITYKNG